MTKGELMKAVYTSEELGNVDSAIPKEFWDTHDTWCTVMDYNEPNTFGKLVNLIELAKERGMNCLWCEGKMKFEKDHAHGDLSEEIDDVFICEKCEHIVSADGKFMEFPVKVQDFSQATKNWRLN